MNKKWVASTALASFLAAVGISSNTSPVKAAVSDDEVIKPMIKIKIHPKLRTLLLLV